jgi:hypothetical protein
LARCDGKDRLPATVGAIPQGAAENRQTAGYPMPSLRCWPLDGLPPMANAECPTDKLKMTSRALAYLTGNRLRDALKLQVCQ